jgi:general secretion pathway protein C
MVLRRVLLVVNFVLTAVFLLSVWRVSVMFGHQKVPPPVIPEADSTTPVVLPGDGQQKKPYEYYSLIAENKIFGVSLSRAATAGSDASSENLPTTSLRLRLVATVTGEPLLSFAGIEDLATKKQDIYKLSDMVSGARIIEILRNKVVLFRDGQREILVMTDDSSKRGPAAPGIPAAGPSGVPSRPSTPAGSQPRPVVPVTPTERRVSRSAVNEQVSAAGKILGAVNINPYFQDGKVSGFRVSGIPKGGILEEMGIREGDVVRAVNGEAITSPQKAYEVFNKVQGAPVVRVDVQRGDKAETLTYVVAD